MGGRVGEREISPRTPTFDSVVAIRIMVIVVAAHFDHFTLLVLYSTSFTLPCNTFTWLHIQPSSQRRLNQHRRIGPSLIRNQHQLDPTRIPTRTTAILIPPLPLIPLSTWRPQISSETLSTSGKHDGAAGRSCS